MDFQTKIPLSKQTKNVINYKSNVLLLGSCFSENIGKQLDFFNFKNTQNPFGILFHPKAIEVLVCRAINNETFKDDDIFFYNELWHCYLAHSKLSQVSKSELLQTLNLALSVLKKQLETASHIIITLGTAWVYKHKSTGICVANCHKLPQHNFLKTLLTVNQTNKLIGNIVKKIKSVNKKASIVFTVSPVRHIKDGFVENMQSKAHLLSAIHLHVQEGVVYFPSYEILMDELRDYRFYEPDMIHPNITAIHYIWSRFKLSFIDENVFDVMKDVQSIQNGLQHRAFNPKSEAHLKFLSKLNLKIEQILVKFPHMSFNRDNK